MIPPFSFIFIEDVELQRNGLKLWLKTNRLDLRLLGDFSNHFEAYSFLTSKGTPPVNLIFLDIELPGKRDGLSFLESLHGKLKRDPQVIIISGNDYILDAFDLIYPISGYVLKPIDEEKLNKAIDKALHSPLKVPDLTILSSLQPPTIIEFGGMLVPIKDILYFESVNSDKKLHRQNGEIIVERISIKELEGKLSGTHFLRIHESFIVNFTRKYFHSVDKKYTAYTLKSSLNQTLKTIPISNTYREIVKKQLPLLSDT